MLPRAISRDMRLRYPPYRHAIVQHLDQRVRVRVEDVRFEAAVARLVVEPVRYLAGLVMLGGSSYPKSKSSTPNFEYSISTLRYSLGTLAPLSEIGVSGTTCGAHEQVAT